MKITLSTLAVYECGIDCLGVMEMDVVVECTEAELPHLCPQLVVEQAVDNTLNEDEVLLHAGIYKWYVEE